jgi:Asp-tRNA(Asn)/Glu-tRNA(Gln) amidotransferase A subunit family amidase
MISIVPSVVRSFNVNSVTGLCFHPLPLFSSVTKQGTTSLTEMIRKDPTQWQTHVSGGSSGGSAVAVASGMTSL